MILKIGPLRNFAIFTGKHLCWMNFSGRSFREFDKVTAQ